MSSPYSALISRFILVLCLACFCLPGCGVAPHQAGVLRLAQDSDASTLDPARAYDTTSTPYVRLLYRGLVDYDQQGNLINELASRHEVSPDGKTYTFWLRKGVKYWDGTPVLALDFRYAIERVLDPATASDGISLYTMIDGAADYSKACTADEEAADTDSDNGNATDSKTRAQAMKLRHVKGITVEGDDKIIFHLNRSDATFLNYLALCFAYAIPEKYVEKIGSKNLSEHPLGCGPFKLVQWVHDGWITMEKNPDYFNPQLPKCNRIEVKLAIASSLQIMLFEQGQLDSLTITDAFPPDFLRLTQSSKFRNDIAHAPMMDIRYVSLNTEMKPFTSKKVRQAFNYAVDRDRIVGFLTGRAQKASGALPPGMPGYNPHLFQYPYNPKKARQLLKEAGYKDNPNSPIPLYYPTTEAWMGKAAQSIQEDLKNVGMSLTLRPMRYSEIKAKAGQRGQAPLAMAGWIQDFPDPANFLDVLFNGKAITDNACINRAFYSNPKVNAILDAAGVETNRPKRLKMYQEAEKMIVDDAPWLFMHHTERYVAYQPWVKGLKLHPMWSARYEYVTVE